MAKFPYIVVKNDTWYPAGTEVPADEPVVDKKEDVLVEQPEEDVLVEQSEETKKPTKTRKK